MVHPAILVHLHVTFAAAIKSVARQNTRPAALPIWVIRHYWSAFTSPLPLLACPLHLRDPVYLRCLYGSSGNIGPPPCHLCRRYQVRCTS
ncbi:unnamed protein product, partial [Dicrocoelium dendriticum]